MTFLVKRGAVALTLATAVVLLVAWPALGVSAEQVPHSSSTVQSPVKFTGGVRARAAFVSLNTTDTRNVVVSGWLDLSNPTASSLEATITFYHRLKGGQPDFHHEKQVISIGAHEQVSVPAVIGCNGLPAGSYEFGAYLKPTADVLLNSASLTTLGMGSDMPSALNTRNKSITMSTSPTKVLQATLNVPAAASTAAPNAPSGSPNALAQGWVNFLNGNVNAAAKLLYYMDGNEMGSISEAVSPGQAFSMFFLLKCNGLSAGSHVFTVKAEFSAVGSTRPVAKFGVLSIASLPSDGSFPNAGAQGNGTPVALNNKTQQFLSTTLAIAKGSDVWMGGWVGLNNTTGSPITVHVQAAMGGDAEGPPLNVTVPKHGQIDVPFGILCTAEPGGTLTLDVVLSASASGVRFTGDGNLAAWASAPYP
jgi:hypothetical protein